MRNCFLVGLSLVVGAGRMAAENEFAATNAVAISPVWIDALTDEAQTNYPALRAAELRADAALWNAAAVPMWEDPVAKFGVMGADRERRSSDGDLIYGAEQRLPLFGKPGAARAVAQAEAITLRHEAAYRAQQLRRDLVRQLIKIALQNRVLDLGREDLASLDTIVATTEDKYRNGLATQVEVLQSQNERAKRANFLRTDENLLRADQSSLNRLLNRKPDSPWPKLLLPPVVPALPPLAEMVRHATETAPQLEVVRASLRQANAAVEFARKRRLPDVGVGVEGRQYSETGRFREGTIVLGFSIPWGNRSRYAADIRREQRRAEATEYEIADMQLSLRDEITRLVIQIENAQREAALYRTDIIPRTQQTIDSAHANWLNNRAALRDLLEARRMLIEARTAESRAIAEQHSILTDLSLHCGMAELREFTRNDLRPAREPAKGGNP